MRVIHDLKNPVSAILQTLNDHELNYEKAKELSFVELEDLMDMLDNLRAEFKSWHLMDVNERERELDSVEFIKGLKRTHSRHAKNRSNNLRFTTESFFPKKLWVQRLNLKRVTNNLISNAIKHTYKGWVDVSIRLETIKIDHFNPEQIIVGANPCNGRDYITFEIKDTGEGIKRDKLNEVFKTDQQIEHRKVSNDFDDIGLGLPICKYVCEKSDSFIR